MNMKKNLIILLLIFSTIIFLYSHPASDIKINYEILNGIIKVEVIHPLLNSPVQDPAKHYIKTVILKINGKIEKTETYKVQENVNSQNVNFKEIKLKKGDKITISTVCNLIGTKAVTIVVK